MKHFIDLLRRHVAILIFVALLLGGHGVCQSAMERVNGRGRKFWENKAIVIIKILSATSVADGYTIKIKLVDVVMTFKPVSASLDTLPYRPNRLLIKGPTSKGFVGHTIVACIVNDGHDWYVPGFEATFMPTFDVLWPVDLSRDDAALEAFYAKVRALPFEVPAAVQWNEQPAATEPAATR